MWSEYERNFWQHMISEEKYNSLIDTINEIPLRDNTKMYSEVVGCDYTVDNLISPNIDLSKLQIGSKVLSLYVEDNDYYVATIISFDLLKKTVNVVYDGFEDEGEYEVLMSDIENYNEEVELFSDDIFDSKLRSLIKMENFELPLKNESKVFAEYFVDGMYYLGTVVSFDQEASIYKIIFSGFQEEGIFEVESKKVLKCPIDCYNIVTDITLTIPFQFPEISNDKEELIDSYLLSKHHSDALYNLLQEMTANYNTYISKENIPYFLRKYFETNNSITFDKLLSIYIFTIFVGMCFLRSYHV